MCTDFRDLCSKHHALPYVDNKTTRFGQQCVLGQETGWNEIMSQHSRLDLVHLIVSLCTIVPAWIPKTLSLSRYFGSPTIPSGMRGSCRPNKSDLRYDEILLTIYSVITLKDTDFRLINTGMTPRAFWLLTATNTISYYRAVVVEREEQGGFQHHSFQNSQSVDRRVQEFNIYQIHTYGYVSHLYMYMKVRGS